MQIKIKDQDQLIDATIEVVDGVMIVSPKDEKWIPKLNETIFVPHLEFAEFITKQWLWEINEYSSYHYDKGWVFPTKEECQSFCDKLNQAINQIKP